MRPSLTLSTEFRQCSRVSIWHHCIFVCCNMTDRIHGVLTTSHGDRTLHVKIWTCHGLTIAIEMRGYRLYNTHGQSSEAKCLRWCIVRAWRAYNPCLSTTTMIRAWRRHRVSFIIIICTPHQHFVLVFQLIISSTWKEFRHSRPLVTINSMKSKKFLFLFISKSCLINVGIQFIKPSQSAALSYIIKISFIVRNGLDSVILECRNVYRNVTGSSCYVLRNLIPSPSTVLLNMLD